MRPPKAAMQAAALLMVAIAGAARGQAIDTQPAVLGTLTQVPGTLVGPAAAFPEQQQPAQTLPATLSGSAAAAVQQPVVAAAAVQQPVVAALAPLNAAAGAGIDAISIAPTTVAPITPPPTTTATTTPTLAAAATAAPLAARATAASVGSCQVQLGVAGQQCGGNMSNSLMGCSNFNSCSDSAWTGACCPAGSSCAMLQATGSACNVCAACWTCGGGVPAALTAAAEAAEAAPQRCAQLKNGDFDYGCVLGASMYFYQAQRSGNISGSATPNTVPWRGDSGTRDVTPAGTPIVAGMYDAGDLSRFPFPGAWAAANLAIAYLQFPKAFDAAGQVDILLENVRWYADFLVSLRYTDSDFIAATWIPPTKTLAEAHLTWGRPEEIKEPATVVAINASTPASDLLCEAAAALAGASALFKARDPLYAERLLSVATGLYEQAATWEGKYSDKLPELEEYYASYSFLDDMAFAAAMLALASGDTNRLQEAKAYWTRHRDEEGLGESRRYDYNNVGQMAGFLIAVQDPAAGEQYTQQIRDVMDKWLRGTDGIEYSPKGMAWIDTWGNLRYVANQAFMGLLHNKLYPDRSKRAQVYTCWARKQMRYILGETGRSYVAGVGPSPAACRQHHRGSSCGALNIPCSCASFYAPGCNPGVLYGALVGGPGKDDEFQDSRQDVAQSEVALDWNAGFTGAMAALSVDPFTWDQCKAAGMLDGRGSVSTALNAAGGRSAAAGPASALLLVAPLVLLLLLVL